MKRIILGADLLCQNKDAALISRTFATIKGDLSNIQWFHTDRGCEFKNQTMDELLKTFVIGVSFY